jgi:hypothetical protein
MRVNIGNNEVWIMNESSFTTFELTWNQRVKVHQNEDDVGICFIL